MNKEIPIDAVNAAKFQAVPWNDLDGCRILITGASGLIGSACIYTLLARCRMKGEKISIVGVVRNIDKARNRFGQFMNNGQLEVVVADLAKPFSVDGPVDYVVHCAGITGNPKLFVDIPVEVLSTAFISTRSVLELARDKHAKGVVFLSSWEVYGMPGKIGAIKENDYGYIDLENVRTSYKESKRVGEQLCVAYAKEYGVPVSVGRISITTGPGFADSDMRFLPQFVRAAKSGQDIVLRSKGDTIRSHVYLYDCVTALFVILLKGNPGVAYNIASEGMEHSVADIAGIVAEAFGVSVSYDDACDTVALGYNKSVRAVLDAQRLMSLGWMPTIGMREMVYRMGGENENVV